MNYGDMMRNNLVNKKIEYLNDILITICNKSILVKKVDRENCSLELILGELIAERIFSNLKAIKGLIVDVETDENLEIVIGLIIRNNLSLCKIIFARIELSGNETDIQEFYKAVFFENMQWTIKHLKIGNRTNDEILPLLSEIKSQYSYIFDTLNVGIDDLLLLKFKLKIKLPSHFKSLENLYALYSKYEHFGLNTITLQKGNDLNEKIERLTIAIHYSLQGIICCFSFMGIENEDLNNLNTNIQAQTDIFN